MAERTTSDQTMTRAELAAYLRDLAEEFEQGPGDIAIGVGNKSVSLSPPEQVECEVEVVERSSVLRGQRESIDIELSWKP